MKKSSIVQTLWIGPKLGRMEKLSLISFLKLGHTVHLYAYSEIDNIPDGVIIKDGNSIISENKIFKYKDSNSYSGFSNLFRYKLLLEKGGFWIDTDMIGIKPLFTRDEYVFASERMDNGFMINSCIIGVPAGTPIMQFCYDTASRQDPNTLKWGVTGPTLLTRAVNRLNLTDFVNAPEVFSPVNWWDVNDFVSKPLSEITNKFTYAIHLYNESWKNNHINKENIFNDTCAYEQLFKMIL